MNKRIKELYRKAHVPHTAIDPTNNMPYETTIFSPDLFAELIVKECINTIDPKTGTKWIKDQTQEEFWKNQSVHLIKKHFGVE